LTTNQQLADVFDQFASGLELLGEGSFRAASYRRVARFLRGWDQEVREFVERDRSSAEHRLRQLPGIGEGACRRILDWVATGRIEDHDALLARVPLGLYRLLEIPGLGPKAVRILWRELGVEDIDQLSALLESSTLEHLPRMGQRTVEKLRSAIDYESKGRGRLSIGVALPIAERILEQLRARGAGDLLAIVGSLRRGCETVGGLDLLLGTSDASFGRHFTSLPGVETVLASSPSQISIRLRVERQLLQVNLYLAPPASWGAALLHWTGSTEHNALLRERAQRSGWQLDAWGLYRGRQEAGAPGAHELGETPIAAADETAIYAALELPWLPPELREDVTDLDHWAERLPEELISSDAIGAELHAHTQASDGKLSIDELARAARQRGYHTLAVTDHSTSAALANGLDARRLRQHIAAVRAANERYPDIRLLAGSEVDILPDGSLDYDDELLRELDLVVASPHLSLSQDGAAATRRLCAAASHPLVHILGHPTGRIVGKRQGLRPDLDAVLSAAATAGTAVEINANPRRLDLCDHQVRSALAAGCRIAINTDVHSEAHFDFLRYGVLTARRGGVTRGRCVNAYTADALSRWLHDKRAAV
jgi:DNA polymerase (family 10)